LLVGVKSENPAIWIGPVEGAEKYMERRQKLIDERDNLLINQNSAEKNQKRLQEIEKELREIRSELDPKGKGDKGSPVALAGRVRVLATTENGPIHTGDPITSSSKPGYGMKASKSGPIIGFSMSNLENGDGKIVINVSRTYYTPPSEYLNSETKTLSDFGHENMLKTEMWVSFSDDFIKKLLNSNDTDLPVVIITSNNPSITLSIIKKNRSGFKVVSSSDSSVSNLSFDWVAMIKISK
jgi:hypothetical protein